MLDLASTARHLFRTLAFLVLQALLCCCPWAVSQAQPAPAASPGRFIALSDIHFDPMASGMVQDLADAEPEAWAAILDRAPPARGRYGLDTPWSLLRGALDAMQAAEPHPAFLILTGDLLAHHFHARFEASGVRDSSPAAYRAFVRKTVAFVSGEIERRFPGKPVFLALGNDDSDCGDYGLVPGGDFLRDTLPLARTLLRVPAGTPFDADWVSGFGYALPNPVLPRVRMVFLNSVFLSSHYRQGCGPPRDPEPGQAALDWLEARLAQSERMGEKVWLMLHIPPGADAFATLHGGACPDGPVSLWKPIHTRRFLALAARYASTLAVTYAGHTHMDEFRLLGASGAGASGFVLGTPGISPIYDQNPGFHVYAYDAAGRLQDRETWYLANLTETGPAVPPAWRLEYVFRSFWDVPALDLATLASLDQRIGTDPHARDEWLTTYPVGHTAMWPKPLSPQAFQTYLCAIGHADPGDYGRCLCGQE